MYVGSWLRVGELGDLGELGELESWERVLDCRTEFFFY